MTTSSTPYTADEIISELRQQQSLSSEYWASFATPTFFHPLGDAWSPAENVRHLIKSTRPVVTALKAPKLLLRLRFGRSKRASVKYDELVSRYHELLAAGGKAGRFAPSSRAEQDLDAWRADILATYSRTLGELPDAIAGWSESSLDKLQLPHPLLGALTVREMLFFTLYHQRHHLENVRRRLA